MDPIYRPLHSNLNRYVISILVLVCLALVFFNVLTFLILLGIGIVIIGLLFYGTETSVLIYRDRISFKESENFMFKERIIEFD